MNTYLIQDVSQPNNPSTHSSGSKGFKKVLGRSYAKIITKLSLRSPYSHAKDKATLSHDPVELDNLLKRFRNR